MFLVWPFYDNNIIYDVNKIIDWELRQFFYITDYENKVPKEKSFAIRSHVAHWKYCVVFNVDKKVELKPTSGVLIVIRPLSLSN